MSEVFQPVHDRFKESYTRLSAVASTLNSSSDSLTNSVARLESAIRKLSLGISSWVSISEWHSQDGLKFAYDEIGYSKFNGKWGFAIRSRAGDERSDSEDCESWPFSEAPRLLRIQGIDKIPDFLDKLVTDATAIQTGIAAKIAAVDALADAAIPVSEASKVPSIGTKPRPHSYGMVPQDAGIQGAKSIAEMVASTAVPNARNNIPNAVEPLAARSYLSTTTTPTAARNNLPLRPAISKGETRK